MTLTLRCCGKTLILEGDADKIQRISDICTLVGSAKSEIDVIDIPEKFGENVLEVFQYFWNDINNQQ